MAEPEPEPMEEEDAAPKKAKEAKTEAVVNQEELAPLLRVGAVVDAAAAVQELRQASEERRPEVVPRHDCRGIGGGRSLERQVRRGRRGLRDGGAAPHARLSALQEARRRGDAEEGQEGPEDPRRVLAPVFAPSP